MILDFEGPIVELENKIKELQESAKNNPKLDFTEEIARIEDKIKELKKEIYSNLTDWQRVQLARHPQRPHFLDYVPLIFTDFIELAGDRNFRDDKSVVCGFAYFLGEPVALIGQQKGKSTEDNIYRNFGMMHPEGYRKALRVMKLAEKFNKPVITFIDTPGAYPGIGAEERGQAEAIARNLRDMSLLEVPIISVVIGEGGSGGALGIGVSDKILMLENAIYSVISPEGCASILWRDATKAPDAAKALKLTAQELYKLGVVDLIIKEPLGGAHSDYNTTAENIKEALKNTLRHLKHLNKKELLKRRYEKYRRIGEYFEGNKLKTSKIK